MEAITGYTRLLRSGMRHKMIPIDIYTKLETAQVQLLKYKPVQYVLGFTQFYGLKLLVDESVLIPRPETEELLEWMMLDEKRNNRHLQVLDIGTGSGCIAIALKKKQPSATVYAVDLSAAALQVAEKNAAINQTDVQFLLFDFLDETQWCKLQQYDIIVSNPPYIPEQEKGTMNKNITDWEPDIALFVPDHDPLLFYIKTAAFGKTHLAGNGAIYMEMHQDYAGAVKELFTALGYTAVIKKDINGNERMVKCMNRPS